MLFFCELYVIRDELALLGRTAHHPRSWASDGSLAKGGLNGGHRLPLPCALPLVGFPYEFGPETERKIPGAWHPVFSAH